MKKTLIAGAGGTIGVEVTVKSPADGYTLAIIATGKRIRDLPFTPQRVKAALG